MPTPNPLAPVKGAGTTLWVYNGQGDAYANPLSDDNWQRLAQVSGQPVNGDREEIQVRQVRRGRKATGESGEIPV